MMFPTKIFERAVQMWWQARLIDLTCEVNGLELEFLRAELEAEGAPETASEIHRLHLETKETIEDLQRNLAQIIKGITKEADDAL